MNMRKDRLYELDIMRTLGVLLIMFHHLPDYAGNFYNLNYFGIPLNLGYANVLNTYFGVGIFVFVSGYVLCYSAPSIRSIPSFLGKRVLRIFPLYVVALALFAATLGRLSMSEGIIHVLGLQVLLAPRFVEPLPTLWFVGMIVLFYLVYALLARYARTRPGTLLVSLAVLGVACLARLLLHLVEYRFFLYFFVFLSGVMCCKSKLHLRRRFGALYVGVAVLTLLTSVLVLRVFHKGLIYEHGEITEAYVLQASIGKAVTVSAAVNCATLSCIAIVWALAKRASIGLRGPTIGLLSFVSYASYGVYLFHRPVFDVITPVLRFVAFRSDAFRLVILVLVGLPLVMVLAYMSQAASDRLAERLGSSQRCRPARGDSNLNV